MNQTMEKIVSNLKPFAVYIFSVLIGLGITFVDEMVGFYLFFAVYLIFGILVGIFTDIKKDKYGLIAYAVMLIVAPLINLALRDQITYTFGVTNVVYGIGSLSNMFCTYFTPFISFDSFILRYVGSVILPFIPILIGFALKKAVKSKKA